MPEPGPTLPTAAPTGTDPVSPAAALESAAAADGTRTRGRSRRLPTRAAIAGVVLAIFVLIAIFAGQIAPHPYGKVVGESSLQGPSSQFIFGTDSVGRDVFSRVVYGTRISLGVAAPSVLISLLIGLVIGLSAAYYGRWLDAVVMRLVDIVFAFPAILLAIALIAVLGPSLNDLVIVIVVLFIPRFAVVVRAAARSVRNQEYIDAAKAMGAGPLWINVRHVIPNIGPVLIVETALSMSTAILTEAALSFLGLGAQPPRPSWGGMLREAQDTMTIAPWTVLYPGLAIVIIVFALNILGDGLRDRFDLRRD
jgi:peptide/nickel transport system permease protein